MRLRRGKRGIKRHQPCTSEFDYEGWKAWGEWKRLEAELQKALAESAETVLGTVIAEKKDCWNHCDYPSECRWGPKLKYQNPSVLADSPKSKSTAMTVVSAEVGQEPAASFEETMKELEENPKSAEHRPPPKDDFWSVVLTSATKRRVKKSPLRLSAIVEREEKENVKETGSGESEGKSEMPTLVAPPPPTLQISVVRTSLLGDTNGYQRAR